MMVFVGLAVTLVIALVLPIWPVRSYYMGSIRVEREQPELPAFMSRWSDKRRLLQKEEHFGTTQTLLRVFLEAPEEASPNASPAQILHQQFEYGLPMRCLSSRVVWTRNSNMPMEEDIAALRAMNRELGWRAPVRYPRKIERSGYHGFVRIPLYIHPLGLVCNSIFWAIVIFLPFGVWKLVVRTDRHLKHKCPSCGYPRGKASDSKVCTECGTPYASASSGPSPQ